MERSIVSASTIGAAASKKESDSPPTRCARSEKSASEQSGPAATTTCPSGMLVASRRSTSMRGLASILSLTSLEKSLRSTASAPPAGTAASRAHSMSCEPMWASSSLRRPAALSCLVDFREFEHTSSAKSEVWCAGDVDSGLCSTRVTATPRAASWSAHSLPASPPPITITCSAKVYLTFLNPFFRPPFYPAQAGIPPRGRTFHREAARPSPLPRSRPGREAR